MIDSSELRLAEFCFASRTRNFVTGKQRHTIDGFRTVCWFHCLRIASGAKTTYQMDALVESPLNSGSIGPVDRKNKWRSYREGKHTPSTGLVEDIESRFPGSRAVLNHPLWQVLRLDRPLQDEIAGLLAHLPPPLYAAVRGRVAPAHGASISPFGWDSRRLRRLEREVGFNTVACVVALMRLAAESGDSAAAHRFGRTLCRMLLMTGGWLFSHGIAQPLADYVEEFLLPMAAYAGQQYGFGEMGFLAGARRLAEVANAIAANENTALRGHYCADLMIDLLDHKFNTALSDCAVWWYR